MTRHDRKYSAAATLMFVSAALHLPIAVLAFDTYATPMIVAAVLWSVLGFGLLRKSRICAYLAFLGMLTGILAALGGALGSDGLVAGLFWLILAADTLAALILFGLLWAVTPAVHSE